MTVLFYTTSWKTNNNAALSKAEVGSCALCGLPQRNNAAIYPGQSNDTLMRKSLAMTCYTPPPPLDPKVSIHIM